jgi:hypothetical protein
MEDEMGKCWRGRSPESQAHELPVGFKNSVRPPDSADLQRDRVNEPYGTTLRSLRAALGFLPVGLTVSRRSRLPSIRCLVAL